MGGWAARGSSRSAGTERCASSWTPSSSPTPPAPRCVLGVRGWMVGSPVGQFWQEDACPHRSSSAVTCGQRWRGLVAARPAPTTPQQPPGAPRTVPTAPAAAPRVAAGAGGGGRMVAQVRAGSTGWCWRCERSAAHGISLQDCWVQPASTCGCSWHRLAHPRHRSLAQPRSAAPRPRCCAGTRGTQVSAGNPPWGVRFPSAPPHLLACPCRASAPRSCHHAGDGGHGLRPRRRGRAGLLLLRAALPQPAPGGGTRGAPCCGHGPYGC